MHWRRKWQSTPVFLPGESQGWEPGKLPSMGSHRVGHDWSDLAVADLLFTKTIIHLWRHHLFDLSVVSVWLSIRTTFVISFYYAYIKWKVKVTQSDSAIPWTIACLAPLCMEFSRQEYCYGLPFPSPGDIPDSGIKQRSLNLQADSYQLSHCGIPFLLYKPADLYCLTLISDEQIYC